MDQKIKSLTTQKLILETSFQMFYENGFNHTSIPDIMKKTNLTKGYNERFSKGDIAAAE